MGELSKKIGEHGEALVERFLAELGWNSLERGLTTKCLYPRKHAEEEGKERQTHGVDFHFHYKSNLDDYIANSVSISVKYSSKKYSKSPQIRFKEHLFDLAKTVECFSRGEKYQQTEQVYSKKVKKLVSVGVLLWLNGDKESYDNAVEKVAKIEIPSNLKFLRVYVVDNYRASFIYDSIQKVRSIFDDDIYFNYELSAQNYKDPEIAKYGLVFPVEYLTAPLIPFRIIDKITGVQRICISSSDEFSEEALGRTINMARDISAEFCSDYTFIFRGYDNSSDQNSVASVLQSLGERTGQISVKVHSLDSSFRTLLDG